MNRICHIFIIFLSCTSALAQPAQNKQELMRLLQEKPERSAPLLYNYEAPSKIIDTPAPKGFKPFYVSHYGRHGSRYHCAEYFFRSPMAVLDSLDAHNLLTDEGKSVLGDMQVIADAHDGQIGYLTHKGARQHQDIAGRLYRRCPELFNQRDRQEVYCVATAVPRCIQSMANFCLELGRENPSLEITMDAGERFTKYLCNDEGVPQDNAREVFVRDSVLNANLDPTRLLTALTTDADEAVKYMKGGARKFFAELLNAGSIGQCLDILDPYIYRHFTTEEIYGIFSYYNVRFYTIMNASVENGRSRDIIGARVLKDIVEKADAAMGMCTYDSEAGRAGADCCGGNGHCADLRFGHDAGLGPILSLLRLAGFEKEEKMAESIDGKWYSFEGMPMASNLQMIFYRNKKGEVLVKFLFNESEISIPSLGPGLYYRWSLLREYLVSKIS